MMVATLSRPRILGDLADGQDWRSREFYLHCAAVGEVLMIVPWILYFLTGCFVPWYLVGVDYCSAEEAW
jgi:hypothetical protein